VNRFCRSSRRPGTRVGCFPSDRPLTFVDTETGCSGSKTRHPICSARTEEALAKQNWNNTARFPHLTGLQWKSAAFSGMVPKTRYTLFLRSRCAFECDDCSARSGHRAATCESPGSGHSVGRWATRRSVPILEPRRAGPVNRRAKLTSFRRPTLSAIVIRKSEYALTTALHCGGRRIDRPRNVLIAN
jgi:hypothetical protein